MSNVRKRRPPQDTPPFNRSNAEPVRAAAAVSLHAFRMPMGRQSKGEKTGAQVSRLVGLTAKRDFESSAHLHANLLA